MRVNRKFIYHRRNSSVWLKWRITLMVTVIIIMVWKRQLIRYLCFSKSENDRCQPLWNGCLTPRTMCEAFGIIIFSGNKIFFNIFLCFFFCRCGSFGNFPFGKFCRMASTRTFSRKFKAWKHFVWLFEQWEGNEKIIPFKFGDHSRFISGYGH